jgi:hypothetical protein
MNEIEGRYEKLRSSERVKRAKKINQRLYDLLFGSLIYIFEYSKKYGIPLPHRDSLIKMADRIRYLMDEIEPPNNESQLRYGTREKFICKSIVCLLIFFIGTVKT